MAHRRDGDDAAAQLKAKRYKAVPSLPRARWHLLDDGRYPGWEAGAYMNDQGRNVTPIDFVEHVGTTNFNNTLQ